MLAFRKASEDWETSVAEIVVSIGQRRSNMAFFVVVSMPLLLQVLFSIKLAMFLLVLHIVLMSLTAIMNFISHVPSHSGLSRNQKKKFSPLTCICKSV